MIGNIFNVISLIFKYLFIVVVYFFIFRILRLIYMDIKSVNLSTKQDGGAYLKLLNNRSTLPFKVEEHYSLGSGLTLGRLMDNSVVLNNGFISKHHCEIIKDENEFFLKDLDSSNGTYLNNMKLVDVVKLKDGDRIGIGPVEFIFIRKEDSHEQD